MAPVYITPRGIRLIAFRFFGGKFEHFFVNIQETLWHISGITREFIRALSAEKIQGSNVLVNKQYSREIVDRRKLLPGHVSCQERKKKCKTDPWCLLHRGKCVHVSNPPLKLHVSDRMDLAIRVNKPSEEVTDNQTKKQRKRSTPDHHSGRYGSSGELTEVITKYDEIGFTETKTDDFHDTHIH